jgi:hypothetical protein
MEKREKGRERERGRGRGGKSQNYRDLKLFPLVKVIIARDKFFHLANKFP